MADPPQTHAPSPAELGYAPRGTAWYYATLSLPPAQRDAQRALQAWWRALRSIPLTVSDPGVAGAKLAWWQTQLGDPARAEHPLLRALQPALADAPQAVAHLRRSVQMVDAELRTSRWIDWGAMVAHLDSGPGEIARAGARLAGFDDDATLAWAGELGVALARVGQLRDLGRDLRHGVIRLPVDLLAAHGVSARALLAREDGDALRALLRDAAAQAGAALDAAAAKRPSPPARSLRPAVAMSAIARTLLRELQAQPQALLEQRIALPPLRLLWHAWRAR